MKRNFTSITFYLSFKEKEKLIKIAKKDKRSISQWVKITLLEKIALTKTLKK